MKRAALAALILVGLVTACKMNLTTDVYSTDLWDAVAGTEGLSTPATMAFQVPSTDKCDEYTSDIAEIMTGIVGDFSPKGCKKDGMESYLLADTQIPIVASPEAWENANSLFGVLVAPQDDDIRATMSMNVNKYRTLTERMEDKFHRSVSLSDSAIIIVLNNDFRNTIEFSIGGVFVNRAPVLGTSTFELHRRQKAEIKFSNVAVAYMAEHGVLGDIVLRKQS